MAVVSPCIGICALERATGFCRGCRRTIDEISGWMNMSDEERLAVLAEIETRPAPLPPGQAMRVPDATTR